MAILSFVNAALVALQIYQHYTSLPKLRRVTRRYETLISMAERLVDGSWVCNYLLLCGFVICDVFAPSLSVFAVAAHPNLLRLLFSIAILAHTVATMALASGELYLSTLMISLQWLALSTLYLFVVFIASASQATSKESSIETWRLPVVLRLFGEFSVTVHAAWTLVVMLHSFAVMMQDYFQACLSFRSYAGLLCTLSLVANWTVLFYKDLVFGLVCTWSLLLVAIKHSTWQSTSLERLQDSVGEAALQLAVMGGTILTIVLAVRVSH